MRARHPHSRSIRSWPGLIWWNGGGSGRIPGCRCSVRRTRWSRYSTRWSSWLNGRSYLAAVYRSCRGASSPTSGRLPSSSCMRCGFSGLASTRRSAYATLSGRLSETHPARSDSTRSGSRSRLQSRPLWTNSSSRSRLKRRPRTRDSWSIWARSPSRGSNSYE